MSYRYKVLLVDDEANVLAGYRRQLRRAFSVDMAQSGPEGLERIVQSGPYAVVVSDMRMPKMSGIEFLAEVRRMAPDTVRVMLTGNADLQTCIDAVNEGRIFRFLSKTDPAESLPHTIEAGIAQYRLVTAERELLEGTLRGCIRTLTDILSVLNPVAFSLGNRIRRYVRHMAAQLNAKHFWEYEMAATLSQIGCVALPPEILVRMHEGRALTSEQRNLFIKHPALGCQLLAEIPRFEMVAQIVALQYKANRKPMLPEEVTDDDTAIALGGQMLRVALDLDRWLREKRDFLQALQALHDTYGPDHPMIVALMSFERNRTDRVEMSISASELGTGMIAAEDVRTPSGRVLVPQGTPIGEALRMHLQSCAQAQGLAEPFRVEVVSERC